MNDKSSGKYKKNDDDVCLAPADEKDSRLYHAKNALKGFINNKATTTDIRVITFNKTSPGTEKNYRTLVDPANIYTKQEEQWIRGHYEGWTWVEGHYEMVDVEFTTINGTEYRLSDNDKVTATDGNKYHSVKVPIPYGARSIGTTADSDLITKVDNISISSEREGFGTNVNPAFELINDNKETYLSSTKKNIVIVLADGKFTDTYGDQLKTLKENVNEIYCIGFGEKGQSYFDESALKNMSTNNKCYTATNSTDLLSVFDEIDAEANKEPKNDDTTEGTLELDEASKVIKVSSTTKVTLKNKDTGKEYECSSESELAQYGLHLSSDKKTITWEANEFTANNPNEPVPSNVLIKYFVGRN